MTKLAEIDVDVEADKLIDKAREEASRIGHAVAIIRRGTVFSVHDSWTPTDVPRLARAIVLRLVGTNGVVVRV